MNEKIDVIVSSIRDRLCQELHIGLGMKVIWNKCDEKALTTLESKSVEKALVKGFFDADKTSLVPYLKRSVRSFLIFQQCVYEIHIIFSSTINYKTGSTFYQVNYSNDKVLEIVLPFGNNLDYTDAFGCKIDLELDLNVLDEEAMEDAKEILKQQQDDMNAQLGSQIELVCDWDFTNDKKFKLQDSQWRRNTIEALVRSTSRKGLREKENGLLDWLKSSGRASDLFKQKVSKIMMVYKDEIVSKRGNLWYSIEYNDQTLCILVKKWFADNTDGWGIKVDMELDLSVKEEIWKKEADAAILKAQLEMNQKLGNAISISVDWSFADVADYKKRDDVFRRNNILYMGKVVEKGLLESKDGLIPFLSQSTRAQKIFGNKINKIVIQLNSEFKHVLGSSYYGIEQLEDVLMVKISKSQFELTDGWSRKVDRCLDLNIHDELSIIACESKLKEFQDGMNSSLKTEFKFLVDWSWCDMESFKSRDESARGNFFWSAPRVLDRGLFDRDTGLVPWLQKSQRATSKTSSLIKTFIIRFVEKLDVTPGSSYYNVNQVNDGLAFTVLANMMDRTDGWLFKVDKCLDLNIKEELWIKEFQIEIDEMQKKLLEFTKTVIQVDWSFVEQESFKKRDEVHRRNQIYAIVRVIKKGLTDKPNGLLDWFKDSQRFTTIFNSRIRKIVLHLVEKIEGPNFGSSYYQVKEVENTLELSILYNYVEMTDGWALKMDREMKTFCREGLWMKGTQRDIDEYQSKLENALGKKIPIEIDWDSLIGDEKFPDRDEIYRRNFIQAFGQIVKRGLMDTTDGLLNGLQDSEIKENFSKNVGIIKISAKDKIQSKIGSSYIQIDFFNGQLDVIASKNHMELTGGWLEKLKHIFKEIRAYKGTIPTPSPQHIFFFVPTLEYEPKLESLVTHEYCRPFSPPEQPKQEMKPLSSLFLQTPEPTPQITQVPKNVTLPPIKGVIASSATAIMSKENIGTPTPPSTPQSFSINSKKEMDEEARRKENEKKKKILQDCKVILQQPHNMNSLREMTDDKTATLAKYKRFKKLGQGAFGAVFLCTKREKLVALKEMLCERMEESNFFLGECLRGIRLAHRNIVKYVDAFNYINEDGEFKVYLEMEYYPLGDFDKFLRKYEIDEECIIEFALQIASGIDHIHNNGMIHRDLKPGNILVKMDNGDLVLAICDFGSSKNETSMRKGSIAGTLNFVAPEVMEKHDCDSSVDIFSFGAILYYMITKKERVWYMSLMKNFSQAMTELQVELEKYNFREEKEFMILFRRCFALEPKDRITARELKETLEKMLKDFE